MDALGEYRVSDCRRVRRGRCQVNLWTCARDRRRRRLTHRGALYWLTARSHLRHLEPVYLILHDLAEGQASIANPAIQSNYVMH